LCNKFDPYRVRLVQNKTALYCTISMHICSGIVKMWIDKHIGLIFSGHLRMQARLSLYSLSGYAARLSSHNDCGSNNTGNSSGIFSELGLLREHV